MAIFFVLDREVIALGEPFDGFLEVEILFELKELKNVAGITRAKALEYFFFRKDEKRRSFFLIKGAQATPARTYTLQLYVGRNDVADIHILSNILDRFP